MTYPIFPELVAKESGFLNINQLVAEYLARHPATNPEHCIDPAFVDTLIAREHEKRDIAWSYGGYLEDRSVFLQTSYLKLHGNFLHLGLDINVPAGTPVTNSVDATVLLVDNDYDQHCGWGPRIILQPTADAYKQLAIIYGHLQNPLVQTGEFVAAGTRLATIGAPPENGNWFAHLHLQTVKRSYLEEHPDWPITLDGYGHPTMRDQLQEIFPDPGWLLKPDCPA